MVLGFGRRCCRVGLSVVVLAVRNLVLIVAGEGFRVQFSLSCVSSCFGSAI